MESDLSLSHEISGYGHVLEEDGEVERAVALPVCDGRVCSVSHQLDHNGKVALSVHTQTTKHKREPHGKAMEEKKSSSAVNTLKPKRVARSNK